MTKRVTFRPFADVLRMHPSTYPDESLRPSLYYSKAELDAIDLELKSTAALFLALRGHDDGTNRSPGACIVQLDTDDALRGLEHRLFPTRQARRYLIRRTVLKTRGSSVHALTSRPRRRLKRLRRQHQSYQCGQTRYHRRQPGWTSSGCKMLQVTPFLLIPSK